MRIRITGFVGCGLAQKESALVDQHFIVRRVLIAKNAAHERNRKLRLRSPSVSYSAQLVVQPTLGIPCLAVSLRYLLGRMAREFITVSCFRSRPPAVPW